MPAFQYVALDSQGKQKKGILEADSVRQARQLLREQTLTALEVTPVTAVKSRRKKGEARVSHRHKITVKELALITRQLATLLQAGLPLEETLKAVAEQTEKPKSKSILISVRSHLLEGFSFAQSLQDFPRSFPALYCATIAAGEQTGHLDIVLNRLADYVEQQQTMRQKIQQALVYPIIMTLVSVLIVVFLLIYVVPQMVKIFSNMGQQMPEMTIILLDISHFLVQYGLYILAGLIILGVFYRLGTKRNEAFRFKTHQMTLHIPLVKNLTKLTNTSRFIRTFGILSQAGVSILEAMRIASQLITNLPIRRAVEDAAQKVKEGANIHLAIKQTGYFQAMTTHLIASGEASGQLEAMLERAANNQDREVGQVIDTTLTLFEPMMILGMGSVVLFIVLAVLLPIFSLDQLGG